MNLPSWYGKYLAKHTAKQQALRKYSESLAAEARPIRDDFYSAPGWRDMGMEITCIRDVAYPWDDEVLRAIREFDPGVVPVWIRWVFMSPSDSGNPEVVVFGRHGIARRLKTSPHNPQPEEMKILGFESGNPQPRPHILEFIWMGEADKRASDLPGAYKPFNWELYYWMRNNYSERSTRDIIQMVVKNPQDRKLKEANNKRSEDDYKRADLERFVNSKLAQVSEVELKEHFLGDRVKKTKPTIILGTTPKETK